MRTKSVGRKQTIYKAVEKKLASGAKIIEHEVEVTGHDLVEEIPIQDVKPNEWYLLRPGGQGDEYRPVYLSEYADFTHVASLCKHGHLFRKKNGKQKS